MTTFISQIGLNPIGEEEFYIYILPEKTEQGITYDAWVFRKGYGVAQQAFGIRADECWGLNSEVIKKLDNSGFFDGIKEVLLSLE